MRRRNMGDFSDESRPKRQKNHRVSDSDDDASGSEEDGSMMSQFNNPNSFMKNFMGYESGESSVEEEDDDEGKKQYLCSFRSFYPLNFASHGDFYRK